MRSRKGLVLLVLVLAAVGLGQVALADPKVESPAIDFGRVPVGGAVSPRDVVVTNVSAGDTASMKMQTDRISLPEVFSFKPAFGVSIAVQAQTRVMYGGVYVNTNVAPGIYQGTLSLGYNDAAEAKSFTVSVPLTVTIYDPAASAGGAKRELAPWSAPSQRVQVTGGEEEWVSLLEKPSEDSRVVARVPAGALLEAIAYVDSAPSGWTQVIYNGQLGWIRADLLRKV